MLPISSGLPFYSRSDSGEHFFDFGLVGQKKAVPPLPFVGVGHICLAHAKEPISAVSSNNKKEIFSQSPTGSSFP
jgi:hypothetical protein